MRSDPSRGVSLIDVLVGSALILVIFLGIFAIVRASLAVSTLAKLKNSATSIAETRMEYARSLDYDVLGTVGGIPAGVIPQYATTTIEGTTFTTRTFIEYADDPADGSGASDSNAITTDYKHVKVSTTYVANEAVREVTLASNFAPPSIETTTNGGTLRIAAVNATGVPVPGASVRIVNAGTVPAVDVTTFTDATGLVLLGGAATSTQYEIYVSKSGYSSAQTYARTATNANPTPGYFTVAKGATTAGTFAIDLLASVTVRTFTPIAPALFRDLFNDASSVSSLSDTQVSGGALTLAGTSGTYPGSGTATALPTAPAYLVSWENASSTLATPPGTDARVSVLDSTGVLLPDSVLPGNSTGFTGIIDLSSVSTTTYPSLTLRASLTSSDSLVAPAVSDWGLGYRAGPVPLPNVAFTLTGAKTSGSTSGGAPIYKTTVATTTGSAGTAVLSLEWDSYTLDITGHTVVSTDPEVPLEIGPGTTVDARIIVTP